MSASIRIVDTARDLGVVINSGLTMSDHVTAVCRSAYYQLRQLRMIVRSLSDDAKKTLVQSFMSCRLDYRNALLFGISGGLIQRLQSVAPVARETEIIDFKYRCLFTSHCMILLRRSCRTTRQVFRRVSSHGHSHRLQKEFLYSRTAAMKQPTDRDREERHYIRTL